METVSEQSLLEDLKKCYSNYESFISYDRVVIPKIDVTVKPEIYELKERMATIAYHIESPQWKNEIFEISSSLGSDTKTAAGMAQGSFMFGIMDSIQAMMQNQNPKRADSEFAGRLHKWNVYLGAIVSMGEKVQTEGAEIYWDILKDEILKRIGNQEICYVKVYMASSGDGKFFTGECRINDMKIPSLSKVVEDIAKKWNNTSFASHKQFFMLRQEKETLTEYPYSDKDIENAVEKAMILFEMVNNDNRAEYYLPVLKDYLKDKILAEDIFNYIPEICTELALSNDVEFSETVTINLNGTTQQYYKTQLAAYFPIFRAVMKTLDKNILKDKNKVFEMYAYSSSSFNAIQKALKGGSKIENLVLTDLIVNVDEGYTVR